MPHAFVPSVPTFFSVYSPTAECYGVFAQYRFRCVLGELGPFREGTGFREPVPVPGIRRRFRRFRCSMGSDRLGSVPEVWTEPVLGTGFWEPEVLRRFRVPEIPFPRFRKLFLCTSLCFDVLWKYIYLICTLQVYILLWKYNFARWKYAFVLWKYTFVLCKYTFVLCHNVCFRLHCKSI